MSFGDGNLRERVGELESLVRFMEPFFLDSVSHACACPDWFFDQGGCDGGCRALREYGARLRELGIEVGS